MPSAIYQNLFCLIFQFTKYFTATLYADKNGLSGTIPTEMGLLTELTDIDFDKNALTGTIPTELGNIQNIVLFELDENALTGSIPTEVGRMTSVRKLDLRKSESLYSSALPALFTSLFSVRFSALKSNHIFIVSPF